jgi:hypothetical protein
MHISTLNTFCPQSLKTPLCSVQIEWHHTDMLTTPSLVTNWWKGPATIKVRQTEHSVQCYQVSASYQLPLPYKQEIAQTLWRTLPASNSETEYRVIMSTRGGWIKVPFLQLRDSAGIQMGTECGVKMGLECLGQSLGRGFTISRGRYTSLPGHNLYFLCLCLWSSKDYQIREILSYLFW